MDTNEKTVKTAGMCHSSHLGFCWSAIFAGTLVGMGLGFLLNLFGVAIGLSAYSSTTAGAETLAIGGVIGMLIGVIVSTGTAGFVSGYLGRCHHYHPQCHGVIYGFVTWSLALMLAVLLLAPTVRYMTSYENSLNPAATASVEVTNTMAGGKAVGGKKRASSEPVASVPAKHLAWSGWLIFVLFIVGAFFSCVGGCIGMGCKKREDI